MLPFPQELTSIKYDAWFHFLDRHPHKDTLWVLNGFRFGFGLGCLQGDVISAKTNCFSANMHAQIID